MKFKLIYSTLSQAGRKPVAFFEPTLVVLRAEAPTACIDVVICEHNLLKNVFSINNEGYFLHFIKNSRNALGNCSNSVALKFIKCRGI